MSCGIFFSRLYFFHFHCANSLVSNLNLSDVHSHHLESIFSSYLVFVFIFNAGFHKGQVIRLQVWHCALIFSSSKQILVNLLLYLCPHANPHHEQNVSHEMHLQHQSASVSLSLAFSCAICMANCNGFILGQSVLYTLFGLFSISLISFSIFLLYSASFFLI